MGQVIPAPPAPFPTSLPPSGPAGGSLQGSYPNPALNHTSVVNVQRPYIQLRRAPVMALPTGTPTRIEFDVVEQHFKDEELVFNAGFAWQVSVEDSGLFLVTGMVRFTANSNGRRYIQITDGTGGTAYGASEVPAHATTPVQLELTVPVLLETPETIALTAFQDSGVQLNTLSTPYSPSLRIVKLGAI